MGGRMHLISRCRLLEFRYVRARGAPPLEPIEKSSHPAGRCILRRHKIAEQDSGRAEVVERSMGSARFGEVEASLEQPSTVHITVLQAEENGGWILRDLGISPDNAFERQGIVMRQTLSHPGVSRGKAAGVELVLVCEDFEYRPVIEGITCLHFIFEGIPFEIRFDHGPFSL